MLSADCCRAVRDDGTALSPLPGHPAALPRSAVRPSVPRRRRYQARPHCGWRALLGRARSPRAYHPSYPVRVPRPAPSFHASFRPHLAVTPWRFPGPSAPRTPGQETFTPKHDRMHGTHAGPEPRAPARRLQALVRLGCNLQEPYPLYSSHSDPYGVGRAPAGSYSAGGTARGHPAGKGLGTFPAASTREQTFHPNMFVELRPLNCIPLAE